MLSMWMSNSLIWNNYKFSDASKFALIIATNKLNNSCTILCFSQGAEDCVSAHIHTFPVDIASAHLAIQQITWHAVFILKLLASVFLGNVTQFFAILVSRFNMLALFGRGARCCTSWPIPWACLCFCNHSNHRAVRVIVFLLTTDAVFSRWTALIY